VAVTATENLGPQFIHRGLVLGTPPGVGDVISDPSIPAKDRADAVLEHLRNKSGQEKFGGGYSREGAGGRTGQHWSSNEKVAVGYSRPRPPDEFKQQVYEKNHLPPDTGVVLHAERPPEQAEVRSKKSLDKIEAFGENNHSEREVSLRRGAKVHVTALSFPQFGGGDVPTNQVPKETVPVDAWFKA